MFAALFERPMKVRAGSVGHPGTPEFVEFFHPCVGCWQEKEIVGGLVDKRRRILIHVEPGGPGKEERASPAYFCGPCWAREVEPDIAVFERGETDVALVAGGSAA